MKKALAILLSLILMFSVAGMAFAEETENTPPIAITFIVDGVAVQTLYVNDGDIFAQDVVDTVGTPTKAATETTEYIFDGWMASDADGNVTGTDKYYSQTFPAHHLAEGETTATFYYVATFAEQDIKQTTSLWAFIQSIFARINLIFEYFAKVFEGIIDFG